MRWLTIIWLCLLPLGAWANEEDKGRLTRFLENTLSGAGRDVSIEGFQGALSSHASIERLSISDADGVWLSLSGIEMIWTRSALLRGRLQVEKLIAAEITLERLPKSEPAAPSPEAGPFALPELPVSIDIGEVNAGLVALGETVLGQAVSFSVNGNLSLDGGNGSAKLELVRTDGKQGHVRFSGGFNNSDRVLSVDLDVTEAEGGIAASLMSIPETPPLHLSIAGTGPLDSYLAKLSLATDGQQRLEGVVGTQLQAELNDQGVETGQTRVVGVDIFGDMAPLFAPQFADFFGPNVSLTSVLRQTSDGRTHLDQLLLNTRSLRVQGEMVLAPKGLPERLALDINIADPDGKQVVLPSVNQVKLNDAQLDLRFDTSLGDRWSLQGRMQDLVLPEITLASVSLDGSGAIHHLEAPDVTADISLRAVGITPTSPEHTEVANALGEVARIATRFSWKAGEPFVFDQLDLETRYSRIGARGKIEGDLENLQVSGSAEAKILDMAMLEPIAKKPLRGSLDASVSGSAQPLSGSFDLTLAAKAKNLLGIDPKIDSLAGEETALNLSAIRDETGLVLRQFQLRSEAVTADAKGNLKTGSGALTFSASLDDVNRLTPDFRGALAISGKAEETGEAWLASVQGQAPGETDLAATLTLPKSGGGSVDLDLAIANVRALFPALSGTATLKAKADKLENGWNIDVDGEGSNIFALRAAGRVQDDFQSGKLSVSGRIPLELANTFSDDFFLQGSSEFDLNVDGPFVLSGLTGTVSTSGTRVSLPRFKTALADVNMRATIANAMTSLAIDGAVSSGGSFNVNGSIGLQAPFNGDLQLALDKARFQLGELVETIVMGDIRVNGPLTGGATIAGLINLEHTEVNVTGASLGSDSVLEITHLYEPAAVRRTRDFAGVIPDPETQASSNSRPFLLDLEIRAENKMFVRGLGLDAEFQGGFALKGPTNAIVTSGELELTRGRVDFLTKRLTLTEGLVRLEGDFVPNLRMVAETRTNDASFEIILAGRASNPDFSINSSPDMPEEEALSFILFGENLESISAIQAAQLASAVAQLNGQGGTGIFGGLRKGIGLDNLDITTDDQGRAGVSAGKHINDRVYTEVGVNGNGESSISLNLDINQNFTVKGQVDADSDTGIGFFFRRDY